ncbi:MAG: NUDIX hydrolase [Alphaproteobacteria bacterium]|nr:NUDIX hydrolase [Alphaproteobacteria bacterium]
MSSIPPFPWTIRATRTVYDNPWLTLLEHDVLNVKGTPHLYTTVHIKRIATGVAAIDAEGFVYLVGQHRFPLRAYSWELVEGGCEPGEEPLNAIQRELKEEAGLVARDWRQVLTLHLSNMLLDEVAFGFLATGLEIGEAEPEESEVLALRRVPFTEAIEMVARGEITDAITVALLFRVRLMAERGELPGDLNRRVLG